MQLPFMAPSCRAHGAIRCRYWGIDSSNCRVLSSNWAAVLPRAKLKIDVHRNRSLSLPLATV
ncbi:hypothetical protein D3C73_1623180 [compost metagenome]